MNLFPLVRLGVIGLVTLLPLGCTTVSSGPRKAEDQYRLARETFSGSNGRPANQAEAAKWYEAAARQGHVAAQRALGMCYELGYGVVQDDKSAAKWFRKAAEKGDPTGQEMTGHYHNWGKGGVTQDYVQAVSWFRKSAEQGCASAQTDLGIALSAGRGVPQDKVEGYMWFATAAALGDQTGKYMCVYQQSFTTPAQRAEGRQRSREWLKSHPRRPDDAWW